MATQSISDLWAQRYKLTYCKAYQQILGFLARPSFPGMCLGEMCRGEVVGRKGWVGVLSRKRCSFGGKGKMCQRKIPGIIVGVVLQVHAAPAGMGASKL